MVSGPPTIATAIPLIPIRPYVPSEKTATGHASSMAAANARPSMAPRNSDAKNSPPRNPEPSDMAEATALLPSSSSSVPNGSAAARPARNAPWPAPSTAGVVSAIPPTSNPPIAGRSQTGTKLRANTRSVMVTLYMIAMPHRAHSTPSSRTGMKSTVSSPAGRATS